MESLWPTVSETQWSENPEESLARAYGTQGQVPLQSVVSSYEALLNHASLIAKAEGLSKGFRAIQVGHWSSFQKRMIEKKKRGLAKESSWVAEVVPNLFIYGANPFHGQDQSSLELVDPITFQKSFVAQNKNRYIALQLVWSASKEKALEDPCFEWASTDVAIDLQAIKPKETKTDRMKWSDVRNWSYLPLLSVDANWMTKHPDNPSKSAPVQSWKFPTEFWMQSTTETVLRRRESTVPQIWSVHIVSHPDHWPTSFAQMNVKVPASQFVMYGQTEFWSRKNVPHDTNSPWIGFSSEFAKQKSNPQQIPECVKMLLDEGQTLESLPSSEAFTSDSVVKSAVADESVVHAAVDKTESHSTSLVETLIHEPTVDTEPIIHRQLSSKWTSAQIRECLQMFPNEINLAHRSSGFPLLMRIHKHVQGLAGIPTISWLLSNVSNSFLFRTTLQENCLTIEACECPPALSETSLQSLVPTQDNVRSHPKWISMFEKGLVDCICEIHHPLLSSVRTIKGSCQCKSFQTMWESQVARFQRCPILDRNFASVAKSFHCLSKIVDLQFKLCMHLENILP